MLSVVACLLLTFPDRLDHHDKDAPMMKVGGFWAASEWVDMESISASLVQTCILSAVTESPTLPDSVPNQKQLISTQRPRTGASSGTEDGTCHGVERETTKGAA